MQMQIYIISFLFISFFFFNYFFNTMIVYLMLITFFFIFISEFLDYIEDYYSESLDESYVSNITYFNMVDYNYLLVYLYAKEYLYLRFMHFTTITNLYPFYINLFIDSSNVIKSVVYYYFKSSFFYFQIWPKLSCYGDSRLIDGMNFFTYKKGDSIKNNETESFNDYIENFHNHENEIFEFNINNGFYDDDEEIEYLEILPLNDYLKKHYPDLLLSPEELTELGNIYYLILCRSYDLDIKPYLIKTLGSGYFDFYNDNKEMIDILNLNRKKRFLVALNIDSPEEIPSEYLYLWEQICYFDFSSIIVDSTDKYESTDWARSTFYYDKYERITKENSNLNKLRNSAHKKIIPFLPKEDD